jgi:hypothetical protein
MLVLLYVKHFHDWSKDHHVVLRDSNHDVHENLWKRWSGGVRSSAVLLEAVERA